MAVYTPEQVLQMGTPSPVVKPPGKSLSIADVEKMQGTPAKTPTIKDHVHAAISDVKDFVVSAAKEYNAAEQEGWHHPVDYSWGMAKGMLSGLVGLGSLSVEGLSGGAKALIGMSKKDANRNFQAGMEAGKKLMDKIAPVVQKHLEEHGDAQEAASRALGIIPQAIQAAGDTGFDLTNSPFVGAATQAVGTLVSLIGLKGAADPVAALLKPKAKEAVEEPPETSPETPEPQTIQPPAKPAAKAKPADKSLDELTAELWDSVRQGKDSLQKTPTEQNASGESSASLEAQSRLREEESSGRLRFQIDPDGNITPLRGVDAVDAKAPTGSVIVQAGVGANPWTVLDRGGLPPAHAQGLVARAGENLKRAVAESRAKQAPRPGRPTKAKAPPDPVVFQANGQLVTRSSVNHAFDISGKVLDRVPGFAVAMGRLKGYVEEIQRNIAPEALGPEAKAAAAILAKNMAESQMKEANFQTKSGVRRSFWNSRMDNAADFIRRYESGGKFEDPILQQAADAYRAWNQRIMNQDTLDHIKYDPQDNYLYHVFKDGDKVAEVLGARYGSKWGDPGFTKDRVFQLYEHAIKAGYVPRFTNPEDLMLARQHASDIAHMKIQSLRDLANYGLAVQIRKGAKGAPEGFSGGEFRAPNGERYWVTPKAAQVLHNAWNTTSLWQKQGIAGDAFRGAMFLKNTLIPFKLGFSLFHPLHVATIDNATGMVRASKELLAGTKDPVSWMKDMLKSSLYLDSISKARGGNRIIKLWKGKIPEEELTDADRQSLSWMAEGGFVPEMPIQYRSGALQKFKDAVQRGSATAVFHAPFAALDAMQKPLFQIWIPSLKAASFLSDARTAIKTDPTLLDDSLRRQMTFRKLAKSVDNRYGEMAYSTLFWNRWMKDVAVANTLSLGWQLGFLREYGGAASDLGQTLLKEGSVASKARTGLLDRPLFSLFYTTQALAYGGLLTWAMTGKSPQNLLDYVYPRVGTTQDGKAKRVSTMFYPREFWSIAKHVQNQGLLSGIGDLVHSKSSGVMGLVGEWATGLNSFGEEISDPNSPGYIQLAQRVGNSLKEFEPISLEAIKNRGGNTALSVAGFTPAPKYVTETKAESTIQRFYDKYYQGKETPYDKVQKSSDVRILRQAYQDADQEKFDSTLEKIREKFKLSPNEEQRLVQSLSESSQSAYIKMFKRLSWQQQKQALDKMTEEEREVYLPSANVDHLRYSYEPPEDQE